MDAALNKNESELGVLVLAELLEMLPNRDSFLDQVVQVLGHLGSQTVLLQDSEDFAASDALDLGDAHSVSKGNADLGGGTSLLGELDNLLNEVTSADLNPGWRRFSVGEASASDTLAT